MARYYIEEDPENPGHMKKKLICGSFLDASPMSLLMRKSRSLSELEKHTKEINI